MNKTDACPPDLDKMKSIGITVLALYDRISLFHTLAPWIVGLHHPMTASGPHAGRLRLRYTDDPAWCLAKDRNEYLLIVRVFLKPPIVDTELMQRLRKRYRRIFFLNGNAGGGIHRPEVLPFVDRFYNKALFRDRSVYKRRLYGGELFSDFYHQQFGVLDQPERIATALSTPDIQKLHQHWNIGVGYFPRYKTVQRFGVAFARSGFGPRLTRSVPGTAAMQRLQPIPTDRPRDIDVHARMGRPGYPSIAMHRQVLAEAIDRAAARSNVRVVVGRAGARRYWSEMQRAKITISPFGWGEVCFRDFEAIRAGSLLMKPDMGHLETWPDVFRPYESYVPLAWDGSDVAEKLDRYLRDDSERARITANAFSGLSRDLPSLPLRAAGVLSALIGD